MTAATAAATATRNVSIIPDKCPFEVQGVKSKPIVVRIMETNHYGSRIKLERATNRVQIKFFQPGTYLTSKLLLISKFKGIS